MRGSRFPNEAAPPGAVHCPQSARSYCGVPAHDVIRPIYWYWPETGDSSETQNAGALACGTDSQGWPPRSGPALVRRS